MLIRMIIGGSPDVCPVSALLGERVSRHDFRNDQVIDLQSRNVTGARKSVRK
jgi:hypothetical protein